MSSSVPQLPLRETRRDMEGQMDTYRALWPENYVRALLQVVMYQTRGIQHRGTCHDREDCAIRSPWWLITLFAWQSRSLIYGGTDSFKLLNLLVRKLAWANRQLAIDCCLVSLKIEQNWRGALSKGQPFNKKHPLKIRELIVSTEQWDFRQLELFCVEKCMASVYL